MRVIGVLLLAAIALAGCSRPAPPSGRWEGTYDTPAAMVAARVEIDSKGNIRISAPNAEDVGDDAAARKTMRENLAMGISSGWDQVEPQPMDFDGRVFRKPNGIAPQMVWDPGKKHMAIVVYLGRREPIRFALHDVQDFSDDPWPAQ